MVSIVSLHRFGADPGLNPSRFDATADINAAMTGQVRSAPSGKSGTNKPDKKTVEATGRSQVSRKRSSRYIGDLEAASNDIMARSGERSADLSL